jgi:hypothetical protein
MDRGAFLYIEQFIILFCLLTAVPFIKAVAQRAKIDSSFVTPILNAFLVSVNSAFTRMFGHDLPQDTVQNNRLVEIVRQMAERSDLRTLWNLHRGIDCSSFIGGLNTMHIRDSEGRHNEPSWIARGS